MRASSIIMGISIFILIFSLGYISVDFYKKSSFSSEYFSSVAPIVNQVMAIDLQKKGVFTPELVATGQLPILVIHQTEDPQDHSRDLITFLDKVGRLLNFESNNDDRIDNNDPIFGRLEVAYIKNRKVIHVAQLSEMGIRQIYLDKKHVKPQELFPNGPKGYWGVVNTAVLADGSRREIRVVPISSSYLPRSNDTQVHNAP
jgi:hypothetical protein